MASLLYLLPIAKAITQPYLMNGL